jgi:hypothetical protein
VLLVEQKGDRLLCPRGAAARRSRSSRCWDRGVCPLLLGRGFAEVAGGVEILEGAAEVAEEAGFDAGEIVEVGGGAEVGAGEAPGFGVVVDDFLIGQNGMRVALFTLGVGWTVAGPVGFILEDVVVFTGKKTCLNAGGAADFVIERNEAFDEARFEDGGRPEVVGEGGEVGVELGMVFVGKSGFEGEQAVTRGVAGGAGLAFGGAGAGGVLRVAPVGLALAVGDDNFGHESLLCK